MIKILFVCHGNICRSPMAEYVRKHLVENAGLTSEFVIDSAATSTEEIGNTPHRGTRRVLAKNGIACGEHRARRINRSDAEAFDLIIGMDSANIRNMRNALGAAAQGKIYKLMEFAGSTDDVADPWYTGDFETTFNDVYAGCTVLQYVFIPEELKRGGEVFVGKPEVNLHGQVVYDGELG